MPKRSSKVINQTAASIVVQSTGRPLPALNDKPEKNPAAVALGRLGGMKGGLARANALTAHKRREIARKAAQSRWSKPQS